MVRSCRILLLLLLFSSCSSDIKTIKIKGSDTEVNLAVQLAESFHTSYPDDFVSVSGGGSGLGIASLINGTADIANSSRGIHDDELKLFEDKDIVIDSFVFAVDAIAFVVADDLGIDSIDVSSLSKLLSGYDKNWSSLTGKDFPVTIYGRQSNSGTHDFVKNKLGIEFSPYAKQMNGNAQILEAIKADHSGIGYVGAGYVIHGGGEGIKVLTIYSGQNKKATSPLDAETIASGNYFFQRPLYQYYRNRDYQKIKSFIDFEKSSGGQEIIRTAGYYPVMKSK
jgi:phosphate transport system substrate-binding protein